MRVSAIFPKVFIMRVELISKSWRYGMITRMMIPIFGSPFQPWLMRWLAPCLLVTPQACFLAC